MTPEVKYGFSGSSYRSSSLFTLVTYSVAVHREYEDGSIRSICYLHGRALTSRGAHRRGQRRAKRVIKQAKLEDS